jgi:O-antigen ligase
MVSLLLFNAYAPHIIAIFLFSSAIFGLITITNKKIGARHLAFAPYGIWIVLSAVLSGSLMPSLTPAARVEAISYLAFPTLFMCIALAVENNILSTEKIRAAFTAISLFFIVLALLVSFMSNWNRTQLIEWIGSLVTHLAYGLSISIPFLLCTAIRSRGWRPLWIFAAITAISIIAFALESRAGIIAAGLGILTFITLRSKSLGAILLIAGAALTFALAPLLSEMSLIQRLKDIGELWAIAEISNLGTSALNNQTSIETNRIISLAATFDFISNFPGTGGGFHMLTEHTFEGWGREVSGHGFFLTIPAESGLVGTTLFLVALVFIGHRSLKIAWSSPEESALVSAFVISIVFGIGHQTEYDQFMYIIGGAIVGHFSRSSRGIIRHSTPSSFGLSKYGNSQP